MKLTVNGEVSELAEPCNISELLLRTGIGAKLVAVELNREVVPREQHEATPLKDGDCVEILRLVGGG